MKRESPRPIQVLRHSDEWKLFTEIDWDAYAGCDPNNTNYTFANGEFEFVIECHHGTKQAIRMEYFDQECNSWFWEASMSPTEWMEL